MNALIKKDLIILFKQMKFFLVLILFFGVILSGPFYSTFVIVYAAMLPLTVMSFDEASKWDSLAAMMPIRSFHLVASKYIMGYMVIFLTAFMIILSTLFRIVLLDSSLIFSERFFQVVISVCFGILMLSLLLPLIFKLGIEKGRLAFFVIFGIGFGVGFLFGGNMIALLLTLLDENESSLPMITLLFFLFACLLSLGSMALSNYFYKQKQF